MVLLVHRQSVTCKRPFARLRQLAGWVSAAILVACSNSSEPLAPLVVASDVALQSPARIETSSDESAWLVWTEVSASGDSTASAARVDASDRVTRWTLSAPPSNQAFEAQIVIVGDRPLVAWVEDNGNDRQHRVASWNGLTWMSEQPPPVNGFLFDLSRLSAGPAGEAYLSWSEMSDTGGSRLLAAQRTVDGTWSSATTLASSASPYSQSPRIAVDSDGRAMAVWLQRLTPANSDALFALRAARFDQIAGTWNDAVELDAGAWAPDIARCGAGEWVALWIRSDGFGARQSLWARRFSAGVWQASVRIDTAPDEDPGPIAVDSAPRSIRAAWIANTVETFIRRGVRMASFDCGAGQWSPPVLVREPSLSLAVSVQLKHASDGRPVDLRPPGVG